MGYSVKAAPFLNVIVAVSVEQRRLGVLLPSRLDNVGDIDQFVVPGVERNNFRRVVGEKVRNDAARHCRHDLLALRRKWHDAELNRIAAGLLVIGDDLLDRYVLFRDEALRPPHFRGRGRSIGDVWARQRPSRGQTQGAAKHRAPAQVSHVRLPSLLWRHAALPRARFFPFDKEDWTRLAVGSTDLSGSAYAAFPKHRVAHDTGGDTAGVGLHDVAGPRTRGQRPAHGVSTRSASPAISNE